MQSRRFSLLLLIVAVLAIFTLTFAASAQQPTTCPALVSNALNELATNCASLERNTACYGFDTVQHTSFVEDVPLDFYTVPGDRSDLTITEAIQTAPFNLADQVWGLNVMSVDANLPRQLPGTGVVYIQTGGVEIENGVEDFEAVDLSGPGVNVATVAAADLLTWYPPSIPGHASEPILALPSGSPLIADAVSESGDFARVVYQNRFGWVDRAALDGSAELDSLPVIGPDDMTPMQDFYFRTGIGNVVGCEESPSLVFIQAPNDVAVDINVFDQPIRIESTIILRTLPPGDQLGDVLEIIVLSGLAVLNPDTPNEIIVPPGFSSTIRFADLFISLGIEGDADEKGTVGTWSQPRPLTQEELDGLSIVEDFPDNITNYSVDIPTVIVASGSGGVAPILVFPNPAALAAAQAACLAGELPADICSYLDL